ncbi:hypothetical protein B4N89_00715 [Embleya scabrispora]|uniref:Uncharacterized protein n=1 Tax=Embleya scabrispora TaxID=159449 RepID=A0A1T3NSK4_9ACTN|nr:hypothetical protein [Embleya scabrispora]OPC79662.1 hypothetical protein B4N89_00715 [Embleya scabrispora]
MTDYPLSLAVEDFVPVLLTAGGAALLVPYLAHRAPRAAQRAATGTCLIFAGGLAKAGWKLTVALDGPDLRWLEKALFPCLGVGFALLAHAALTARANPGTPSTRTEEVASRPPPLWAFLAPAAVAGAAAAAVRGTWPLLLLTVAMSALTAVRLIILARADDDIPSAALLGTWLLGMFALGPLASRPDQSVTLQWIEQSCNTLTQAAFAWACARLARRHRRTDAHPKAPFAGSSRRTGTRTERKSTT